MSALGPKAFDRLSNLTEAHLLEIARVSGVAASMACEKTGAEPPTASELKALLATLKS
jgi:fructokinase